MHYCVKTERAPPRPIGLLRCGLVCLTGLIALVLWAVCAAGAAAAIGVDDNCPAPSGDKNVIISDAATIRGTARSDHICGGSSANVIIGGLLDDEIYGGGGNDTIIGGHGTDLLDGGSGDDWLRGGDGQDCYVGGFRSESSIDTVSFADMTPDDASTASGVVVDLSAADSTVEEVAPSCTLFEDDPLAGPGRALGELPTVFVNV